MRWQWLHRAGKGRLLLFLNGWGMDAKSVAHLLPGDYDLLMLFDYSSRKLPQEVDDALRRASSRSVFGWSMGVWIGSQLLAEYQFEAAVACNGTLCPIDDRFGIAPEIFSATMAHLDEQNLLKFYQRMCGKRQEAFFPERAPGRDIENQLSELKFFWDLRKEMSVVPEKHLPWQRVILSRQDRIFRAAQQRAFWQERLPVKEIDTGHYPFTLFCCWADWLAL